MSGHVNNFRIDSASRVVPLFGETEQHTRDSTRQVLKIKLGNLEQARTIILDE